MEATIEPEFICGVYHVRVARAPLFGKLVALAFPILERYQSDLYHDALWIEQNVEGPMTFYFSCDESGTMIGLDFARVSNRENVWKVELIAEHERANEVTGELQAFWYVAIQPVQPVVHILPSA